MKIILFALIFICSFAHAQMNDAGQWVDTVSNTDWLTITLSGTPSQSAYKLDFYNYGSGEIAFAMTKNDTAIAGTDGLSGYFRLRSGEGISRRVSTSKIWYKIWSGSSCDVKIIRSDY